MRITKHAEERIKERNIKTGDIAWVLRNGKRMVNKWDDNKITYVDYALNLYVVTGENDSVIITVFRKEK